MFTPGAAQPRPAPATAAAKAPLRISLAGGGTDLPSYAAEFGGEVVAVAIDRYVGAVVHPFSFDGFVRGFWETPEQAPTAAGISNPFARAALLRSGVTDNVQVSCFGDAPSGSGAGGSAAFTVALLHALETSQGREPSAGWLAMTASAVEMSDLGRPVGAQDHYTSALGGLQHLHIGRDGTVDANSMPVTGELAHYFAHRLLLFHTGLSRDAAQVLTAQADATRTGSARARELLHGIRALAPLMADALRAGRADEIGPLLELHWQHKRQLSTSVTTGHLDELHDLALASGADGAKVVGAGGGGFLLVSSKDGAEGRLRAELTAVGLHELPFAAEQHGSRGVRLEAHDH
ncbi:GHMP family kinase ATP-binding protein [Streptomyces sp. NPDC054770]